MSARSSSGRSKNGLTSGVVPPTVSEDAPTEPHMGEPPSPSQPQPVYPEDEPADEAEPEDAMEAEQPASEIVVEEEVMRAMPKSVTLTTWVYLRRMMFDFTQPSTASLRIELPPAIFALLTTPSPPIWNATTR